MTKADVVNKIDSETDIDKSHVKKTIEAFMEIIKDSIGKGENIYLRGFGTFEVKEPCRKESKEHFEKFNNNNSGTSYSFFLNQ